MLWIDAPLRELCNRKLVEARYTEKDGQKVFLLVSLEAVRKYDE